MLVWLNNQWYIVRVKILFSPLDRMFYYPFKNFELFKHFFQSLFCTQTIRLVFTFFWVTFAIYWNRNPKQKLKELRSIKQSLLEILVSCLTFRKLVIQRKSSDYFESDFRFGQTFAFKVHTLNEIIQFCFGNVKYRCNSMNAIVWQMIIYTDKNIVVFL